MTNVHELYLGDTPGAQPDLCNGLVTFIGTATVLLRYGGFTILTDPNFLHAGDHVHLGYGLRSRRRTNPAIEIEDLPPLDLCLLSHYHGDHFDRIAAERLDKGLPIVTNPHAAKALRRKGFRRLYGMNNWDSAAVRKNGARLRITSMPGKHATGLASALLPPVMGSMLEFGQADGAVDFRIYISGDTLLVDEIKEIPAKYPGIHLGLIHLGGTQLLGLLTVTMDAEQGVEALRIVRPRTAITIHYNDYPIFKSSLEDFKQAAAEAKLATQLIYLSHGESYEFQAPSCEVQAA